MNKKFFIETVGCQMNVLDSELAAAELIGCGYESAAQSKDADIILFNTCSVREHAEEKVYSALGRLKHWKEYHPDGILGVMGCMAQKDQKKIFRRAPHVDLVMGPGRLARLPELIATALLTHEQVMEVSLDRDVDRHSAAEIKDSFHLHDPIRLPLVRMSVHQAMVRIMFGCNKFCSYCIVPRVRGPEQSRPAADIISEITTLAGQGCREVTLIGQTVNNWRFDENGRRLVMADLLERVNAIDGIERIRFVSNYPTGMTDELLQAVRDLPKVMPFIHVPAQHGANSVLKRMRRMYTVEEYRDLLDRIYSIIPGVSVTSDFIVGFCGETEEEFEQTVELVRYGLFKNSFIFKYSPREGTKSALEFEDTVSEADKKRRNNELLDLQTEISTAANRQFVGRTVEILVEGPSRSQVKEEKQEQPPLLALTVDQNRLHARPVNDTAVVQLTGRTPCDRIVVFDGELSLTGQLVQVRITQSHPFTLMGELVSTT
ncbi:MAG: tRNA (N6-isopentenyl adenosine(37)-C2)-methylthiotransferase MiaB [Thermoguttaceae bacterium]|nr:tRNA (N6-isopentenyl adenosine(37)-C2)-methylthiotransferase MiaB [Thermoguttaceae bacterium]